MQPQAHTRMLGMESLSRMPGGPSIDAPLNDESPAVAGAVRKRGRDIRGIDRFRQVAMGKKGFPLLHAMVSRNPVLMYPPPGIDAARLRIATAEREAAEKSESAPQHSEDAEMWALFEERRAAEDAARADGDGAEDTKHQLDAEGNPGHSVSALSDHELANYHHKQLDAFVRIFYEFNHATFVKLPVKDTLQLLSRCGREAVAHTIEYEMHMRLQREARIKELRDLQDEERLLHQRRLETEGNREQRLLAEAEAIQQNLEVLGEDAWCGVEPTPLRVREASLTPLHPEAGKLDPLSSVANENGVTMMDNPGAGLFSRKETSGYLGEMPTNSEVPHDGSIAQA